MDAIQRFNKQTSGARVFQLKAITVYHELRTYAGEFTFICLDDVTITESTGIIIVVFLSMSSDTFMLESYFNFRRTRGQRLYNLFVLTWL